MDNPKLYRAIIDTVISANPRKFNKLLLKSSQKIKNNILAMAIVNKWMWSSVETILSSGANPNRTSRYYNYECDAKLGNDNPLITTASKRYFSSVQLLLEHGAKPNIEVLSSAIAKLRVDLVKFILDKGVNPYELNSEGKTAMEVLEEVKDPLHFLGDDILAELMDGDFYGDRKEVIRTLIIDAQDKHRKLLMLAIDPLKKTDTRISKREGGRYMDNMLWRSVFRYV